VTGVQTCALPILNKTVTATCATLAILSVMGVALYAGLQELLAENSVLWSFS